MFALLPVAGGAFAQFFQPGNLVVSRTVYTGNASTVTIGQTLPGGGKAIANGSYPNVFNNDKVDSSFGVTSPIFLDQLTTSGTRLSTYAVPTTLLVTSFPSKSELALNLSTNGTALTFAGYAAPDQRTRCIQLQHAGNHRAGQSRHDHANLPRDRAVKRQRHDQDHDHKRLSRQQSPRRHLDSTNNQYFVAGNAGNGNGSTAVTNATGVQIVTPGQNATSNTPGTTKVGNFNITQNGYPADKTAKDNNFRGETIFNNTLYVTKGSGSNGINTVYQVGNAGSLPTAANAANAPITILPGFSTVLAKNAAAMHPFGLFFANADTLYVADEGNQSLKDTAANNTNAGLQKYSLIGGTWTLDYTLQNGLNLDVPYTVSGLDPSLDPATDGLRNLTGEVNADGTVTLFAVTSTISASGDQGADPNKLVAITDTLAFTSLGQASGEQFATLESAGFGEAIRGVSFAPTPEPGTLALLAASALSGAGLLVRRRTQARNIA